MKNRISSPEVKFVQREENECTDRLTKAAFAKFMSTSKQVLSFVQISLLIDDGAQMQEVNFEENWTTPLIAYLRSGILLDRKDAARKLKVQASRFVLLGDVLYKKGFS